MMRHERERAVSRMDVTRNITAGPRVQNARDPPGIALLMGLVAPAGDSSAGPREEWPANDPVAHRRCVRLDRAPRAEAPRPRVPRGGRGRRGPDAARVL